VVASRYVRDLDREIISMVGFKTDVAFSFSFFIAVRMSQTVLEQE
jgi:hypothetical protein